MSLHPAVQPGAVAVITGAASGIGLAAAQAFALMGLKIALVDLPGEMLEAAARALGGRAFPADVSDLAQVQALEAQVRAALGPVAVLMNNAGIQPGSAIFGAQENWERVISVNLWGVIHGARTFLPGMIAKGAPGLVINTGSKQGITTPPGDPAYNVAKAGVKAFTEALQHELRNTAACAVTAHLLIPGFVYTALTKGSRTEKPSGAWTPEQTVTFMLESLGKGDFYILCPDNDVPRKLDERRIAWAAGDIIENRPPLSRWHKDHTAGFAAFLKR